MGWVWVVLILGLGCSYIGYGLFLYWVWVVLILGMGCSYIGFGLGEKRLVGNTRSYCLFTRFWQIC